MKSEYIIWITWKHGCHDYPGTDSWYHWLLPCENLFYKYGYPLERWTVFWGVNTKNWYLWIWADPYKYFLQVPRWPLLRPNQQNTRAHTTHKVSHVRVEDYFYTSKFSIHCNTNVALRAKTAEILHGEWKPL